MIVGISSGHSVRGGLTRTDAAYWESLVRHGADPVYLPVGKTMDEARACIAMIDGLVLTGGPDVSPALYGEDPHKTVEHLVFGRDDFETKLYLAAREVNLPILGVCRGMQLINVIEGGTLIQDIPDLVEDALTHAPRDPAVERHHFIRNEGRMKELFGERAFVNSVHHQALARVADGFEILARAKDGIVEAIASEDKNVLAVQFHPEREETGAPIWKDFLGRMASRAEKPARGIAIYAHPLVDETDRRVYDAVDDRLYETAAKYGTVFFVRGATHALDEADFFILPSLEKLLPVATDFAEDPLTDERTAKRLLEHGPSSIDFAGDERSTDEACDVLAQVLENFFR